MSPTRPVTSAAPARSDKPITAPSVRARKVRTGSDPIVMVTAYDAPGARVADEAGVDVILVGDSLAMVVLGYDDTLQVTIDDMAHHVGAVARAKPRPLVVGDLPWMSYHVSADDTVRNAARLDAGRRLGRQARRRPQAGAVPSRPSSTPRSPSWATSD